MIWNLASNYFQNAKDPQIEIDIKAAEKTRQQLEEALSQNPILPPNQVLYLYEDLYVRWHKLYSYSHLYFWENMQDIDHVNLMQRLTIPCSTFHATLQQICYTYLPQLTLDHWNQIHSTNPDLVFFCQQEIMKSKDSPTTANNNVNAALQKLDLLQKNLKYTDPINQQPMTRIQLMDQVYTRLNQSERKKALSNILQVHRDHDESFSQIYRSIILSTYQLKQEEINNPIYTSLNHCLSQIKDVIQKYTSLKTPLLGQDYFLISDIHKSTNNSEKEIDFASAQQYILDSFAEIDAEFCQIAAEHFHKQLIHSELTPGKRGGMYGAYCAAPYHPKKDSYLSVNYQGRLSDVVTLTHELGHAIHHRLRKNCHPLNFHIAPVFNEIMSLFCEINFCFFMLKQQHFHPQQIICQLLDKFLFNCGEELALANFQLRTYENLNKNEHCDYAKVFYQESERIFPNSVLNIPDYGFRWSVNPIIFKNPLAKSAYAPSFLIAFAIFDQYLQNPTTFLPKFKQVLSTGRIAKPLHLLEPLGINPQSEQTWRQACKLIEQLVDRLG